MNRGVGRRVVFVDRRCVRFFLAQVAKAVRRGELEVHCFAVLGTHFHLLVRSSSGQLSKALGRIQSVYVRWFNERYDRDGPLFRGRFTSKRIADYDHRRRVCRYIDENPVAAGIVRHAGRYPFGSARFGRSGAPPWLSLPADSSAVGCSDVVAIDRLAEASGPRVRDRLEQLSRSADGMTLTASEIPAAACIGACASSFGSQCAPSITRIAFAQAASTATLRDHAGMSWAEIARLTGTSAPSARRRFEAHKALIRQHSGYRRAFEALLVRLKGR